MNAAHGPGTSNPYKAREALRRTMRVPSLAVAAFLLALAASAPAGADHGSQSFDAQGTLQFGAAVLVRSVDVTLPSWAPGHRLWLNGTSAAPHDLDAYFSGGGNGLQSGCATMFADETCRVPPGAQRVRVVLYAGAMERWTVALRSSGATYPPACSDGVDNDGDLAVDHPDDPDCMTAEDDIESYPGIGSFADGKFHEIGLFSWDTATLDVLVVPPAASDPVARTAAIRASLAAWEAGIAELGAPWLVQGLDIRVYTLGVDVPPASALADPEVVILSAEYNPAVLLGVGVSAEGLACNSGLPATRADAPWTAPHRHDGSPWSVAMCRSNVDNVCVVSNHGVAIAGAFTEATSDHWMYDLNAHEFGHCLGIGHVGDALDFSSQRFPVQDIMSYQHDPEQVHCVSNLNLRTLEGMFAKVLGRPQVEWLAPLDDVAMAPADYEHVSCQYP